MKPREANQMAQRLKGLLPRMTDEQVLYWAEAFERYELAAVETVIAEYVKAHAELETPMLHRMLWASSAPQRNDAELRHREDLESRQAVEETDRLIAGLSDTELAGLKVEVLARVPRWTRRVLASRDPRTSVTLKGLIVTHMQQMQGSAHVVV